MYFPMFYNLSQISEVVLPMIRTILLPRLVSKTLFMLEIIFYNFENKLKYVLNKRSCTKQERKNSKQLLERSSKVSIVLSNKLQIHVYKIIYIYIFRAYIKT